MIATAPRDKTENTQTIEEMMAYFGKMASRPKDPRLGKRGGRGSGRDGTRLSVALRAVHVPSLVVGVLCQQGADTP